jgi:hypothetical protein
VLLFFTSGSRNEKHRGVERISPPRHIHGASQLTSFATRQQLIATVKTGGGGRPWRHQYAQQGQNDYRVAHSIALKHCITMPTTISVMK